MCEAAAVNTPGLCGTVPSTFQPSTFSVGDTRDWIWDPSACKTCAALVSYEPFPLHAAFYWVGPCRSLGPIQGWPPLPQGLRREELIFSVSGEPFNWKWWGRDIGSSVYNLSTQSLLHWHFIGHLGPRNILILCPIWPAGYQLATVYFRAAVRSGESPYHPGWECWSPPFPLEVRNRCGETMTHL